MTSSRKKEISCAGIRDHMQRGVNPRFLWLHSQKPGRHFAGVHRPDAALAFVAAIDVHDALPSGKRISVA